MPSETTGCGFEWWRGCEAVLASRPTAEGSRNRSCRDSGRLPVSRGTRRPPSVTVHSVLDRELDIRCSICPGRRRVVIVCRGRRSRGEMKRRLQETSQSETPASSQLDPHGLLYPLPRCSQALWLASSQTSTPRLSPLLVALCLSIAHASPCVPFCRQSPSTITSLWCRPSLVLLQGSALGSGKPLHGHTTSVSTHALLLACNGSEP